MVQQYNSGPLLFEVVDRSGPSHMPSFTVVCSAFSISEVGTASKIKLAKQKAAEKVLKHLKFGNINCQQVNRTNITEKDVGLTVLELPSNESNTEINDNKKFQNDSNEVKMERSLRAAQQHLALLSVVKAFSENKKQKLFYICEARQSEAKICTLYIKKKLVEVLQTEEPRIIPLKSKKSQVFIVGFELVLSPHCLPLIEIAIANTAAQAEGDAIRKILNKISYLLNLV